MWKELISGLSVRCNSGLRGTSASLFLPDRVQEKGTAATSFDFEVAPEGFGSSDCVVPTLLCFYCLISTCAPNSQLVHRHQFKVVITHIIMSCGDRPRGLSSSFKRSLCSLVNVSMLVPVWQLFLYVVRRLSMLLWHHHMTLNSKNKRETQKLSSFSVLQGPLFIMSFQLFHSRL